MDGLCSFCQHLEHRIQSVVWDLEGGVKGVLQLLRSTNCFHRCDGDTELYHSTTSAVPGVCSPCVGRELMQNTCAGRENTVSKANITSRSPLPPVKLGQVTGLMDLNLHLLTVFRQHGHRTTAPGLPACCNSPLAGRLGSEGSGAGLNLDSCMASCNGSLTYDHCYALAKDQGVLRFCCGVKLPIPRQGPADSPLLVCVTTIAPRSQLTQLCTVV